MSDLDGYSVAGDNNYTQMNQSFFHLEGDDFGFDPAPPVKLESYSPASSNQVFGDFQFDPIKPAGPQTGNNRATELEPMLSQHLSQSANAVSRYGQVTPPRSNSESSTDRVQKPQKQRRVSRPSAKIEQDEGPKQASATGRKRRNTRKNSIVSVGLPEDDDRRKQSLEKNRLAAAKCRVNKKEKTEQLQRDSHDKAVQNALLKEQLMHMKEEVQRMNALLLGHATCEGCKSPDDLNKHLNALGNEFFTHHMSTMPQDFQNFNSQMDELDNEHYFSPGTDASLNPPLPEFKQETDFDMCTPMHTD